MEKENLAKRISAGTLLSFLELLPVPVYLTDVKGKILFWNKEAETATGWGEEILSRNCEDILRHRNAKGNAICREGCPLRGRPLACELSAGQENATMFAFLSGKKERAIPVAWSIFRAPGREEGIIFHIFDRVSAHVPIEEQNPRVRGALVWLLTQLAQDSWKMKLDSKKGEGTVILKMDLSGKKRRGIPFFLPRNPSASHLTPREREVLALFGKGLHAGEIAEMLGVTPSTIKTHFHSIYKKHGVRSRSQLALIKLAASLRRKVEFPSLSDQESTIFRLTPTL